MADRTRLYRTTRQAAGRGRTGYSAPGKKRAGTFKARAPEGPGGGRVVASKTTRTTDMKPFSGGGFTKTTRRK